MSALTKPKNLYYYSNPKPYLAAMAASYAYGIAKNHPFVDGNKRTVLIICRLFLNINGHDLTATSPDKYQVVIQLASGNLSEQALAGWIRSNLR